MKTTCQISVIDHLFNVELQGWKKLVKNSFLEISF